MIKEGWQWQKFSSLWLLRMGERNDSSNSSRCNLKALWAVMTQVNWLELTAQAHLQLWQSGNKCSTRSNSGTSLIVESREREKVRNGRPGSAPKAPKPRGRSRTIQDPDPGVEVEFPEVEVDIAMVEVDINRQGNFDWWARASISKLSAKKSPRKCCANALCENIIVSSNYLSSLEVSFRLDLDEKKMQLKKHACWRLRKAVKRISKWISVLPLASKEPVAAALPKLQRS